ncbi:MULTISPECIES: hypothetical protein [Haloarcula]|uniref:DUF8060 domain-containing protein n=1 Tax=Haloarcula pellucida TaxID=1427151 RepID=A0A830GJ23_9EURY|nr:MULTISPECIES: hypothetical protein [Halomicroarcula]MDS0276503.1 hypothetical protein [Halomicroarcula sp. S1AR25-4]GGN89370.1 hypothetical protein GCM10009030_10020 [Halomicroarcula pellucida]
MTEEPTTESTAPTDQKRGGPSAPPGSPENRNPSDDESRSAVEYLEWAALTVLVVVALIATLRFYFSVSAAVDTFVTHRYRPLFMAGFNLVVLLGCGIGLSALVRRLA